MLAEWPFPVCVCVYVSVWVWVSVNNEKGLIAGHADSSRQRGCGAHVALGLPPLKGLLLFKRSV